MIGAYGELTTEGSVLDPEATFILFNMSMSTRQSQCEGRHKIKVVWGDNHYNWDYVPKERYVDVERCRQTLNTHNAMLTANVRV